MSTNKFTIEVEIPQADILLQSPSMFFPSQPPVLSKGLLWSAEALVDYPDSQNGTIDGTKECLICYLYCRNPSSECRNWICRTNLNIEVVKLNAREPRRRRGRLLVPEENVCVTSATFTPDRDEWGFDLMTLQDIFLSSDYVKENKVLVRIHVEPEPPSGIFPEHKLKISEAAVATQRSRMLALLRSGSGINVTFVAKDGKKVGAHRDILAAGSPVFLAMFETPMQEAQSGEVELPDMTSEALERLFEYIYGAPLSELDNGSLDIIQELIYGAEKYDLGELKDYCGTLLVERVTPANALQLYRLTRMYKLEYWIKEKLEEFVKQNVPDFLDQVLSTLQTD